MTARMANGPDGDDDVDVLHLENISTRTHVLSRFPADKRWASQGRAVASASSSGYPICLDCNVVEHARLLDDSPR